MARPNDIWYPMIQSRSPTAVGRSGWDWSCTAAIKTSERGLPLTAASRLLRPYLVFNLALYLRDKAPIVSNCTQNSGSKVASAAHLLTNPLTKLIFSATAACGDVGIVGAAGAATKGRETGAGRSQVVVRSLWLT